MLNAVLSNYRPSEWENATYSTNRYQLFMLSPGDIEYETEVNLLENGEPRLRVAEFKRVQNPYQLGRFVIRKEQKQFRNERVHVVKYYHCVNKMDLDSALEFNMDVRRYNNASSGNQVNNKNPKFYNNAGVAASSVSGTDKVILICDVLQNSSQSSHSTTYKENDAEYMPKYVATLY